MISKPFKIVLGILVVVVAGAALTLLHLDNAQLRRRLAGTHQRSQSSSQLRQENEGLKGLLARTEGDDAGARQAIQAELLQARSEVAELEKRAAEKWAQSNARTTADAQALANNRDPTKGLTRLEYFREVGQLTPSAAFQSAACAALNGDDAALAKLLVLSQGARDRATELIASLPEGARAAWTPEKLEALTVTGLFSEVVAAEVVSDTVIDAQRATVVVRIPGGPAESKVPMQWGPSGWQVVVGEGQIQVLQKKMGAATDAPPKK